MSSDAGQPLVQERLRLYGRWVATVTFAFYVLANLPLDAYLGYRDDWVAEWFGVHELLNLGVAAAAGVVWLVTRGPPRGQGVLRALDALGLIGPATLMALAVAITPTSVGDLPDVFAILLGATHTVVARAVVVPSSARRTAVLSAIAFVPVVLAMTLATRGPTGLPERTTTYIPLSAVLWAAVAVTSATVTSRILFRLRTEVAAIRRLGQYTLEEELGRGAMGIVVRARHALLRRPTAIKLLAPSRNSDADLRRFEREVQLTASLTHPNTVAIYDFGRAPDGAFYYAMELIEGPSLEELVRAHGPQPGWRVVHILRQVCGALAEAHEVGLIHRDVKPANVMLCVRGGQPDAVKVLDFGLVRAVGGDGGDSGGASAIDVAVGTPLYMSPEAIESPALVDARSDLYALGATAYFLTTGTPVFSGKTTVAICSRHLGEAPEPPSRRLGRAVNADMEAVILRCLEKDPAARPAGAAELEALLAACDVGEPWSRDKVKAWWATYRERRTS